MGTPVFYVGLADSPARVAVDWTGRAVGMIGRGGAPNADGSLLMVGPGQTSGPAVIAAATGVIMGAIPPDHGDPFSQRWTGDGRYICGLSYGPAAPSGGRDATLTLTDVNGHTRNVLAGVGRSNGGDSGDSLTACSARSDLVVIDRTVCCHLAFYSVRRLSTGALLRERDVPQGAELWEVPSRDARLIAENGLTGAVVVDGITGRVLARRPGVRIVAFADDGVHALTTSLAFTHDDSPTTMMRWQTGAVAWTLPGVDVLAVQPGGATVLVAVPRGPSSTGSDDTRAGVGLVRIDASRVSVADHVVVDSPT